MEHERLERLQSTYQAFVDELDIAKEEMLGDSLEDLTLGELKERIEKWGLQISFIAYNLMSATADGIIYGEVGVDGRGWRNRMITAPGLRKIKLGSQENRYETSSYYLSMDTDGHSPLDATVTMIALHGVWQDPAAEKDRNPNDRLSDELEYHVALGKAYELRDAVSTFRVIGRAVGMELPPKIT